MMQKLLDLVQTILSWLPQSPFSNVSLPAGISEGLGWLNWFIPVHEIFVLATAWLGAIALYYLASVMLRWVKVIS